MRSVCQPTQRFSAYYCYHAVVVDNNKGHHSLKEAFLANVPICLKQLRTAITQIGYQCKWKINGRQNYFFLNLVCNLLATPNLMTSLLPCAFPVAMCAYKHAACLKSSPAKPNTRSGLRILFGIVPFTLTNLMCFKVFGIRKPFEMTICEQGLLVLM